MAISGYRPCAAADYVPGQFYKRELPSLRAVIVTSLLVHQYFVIDGYVWLGATDAPGLGAHLFKECRNANCWSSKDRIPQKQLRSLPACMASIVFRLC